MNIVDAKKLPARRSAHRRGRVHLYDGGRRDLRRLAHRRRVQHQRVRIGGPLRVGGVASAALAAIGGRR
jgi:hypothetical protein